MLEVFHLVGLIADLFHVVTWLAGGDESRAPYSGRDRARQYELYRAMVAEEQPGGAAEGLPLPDPADMPLYRR